MHKIPQIITFVFFLNYCYLQAQNLPDIGFKSSGWQLDNGAVIKDGILSITGNPAAYIKAQITVPYELIGDKKFYVVASFKMQNIIKGAKVFEAPKIKLYAGEKNIGANNLAGGNIPDWTCINSQFWNRDEKADKYIIEVAVQGCSGIMDVKDIYLTFEKPEVITTFPFTVPKSIECILNVNTQKSKALSADLLGLNSHFLSTAYGYNSPEVIEASGYFRIPLLRFPGGTVGNLYNYETDTFDLSINLHRPPSFFTWINRLLSEKVTFGFEKYAFLCKKNNIKSMLMYNINYPSPERAVKWLENRKKSGITVKWIELGNESHNQSQCNDYTDTLEKFTAVTKEISKAIKTADQSVKCAIPLYSVMDETWNIPLAKENYYDAGILHPYVYFGKTAGELDSSVISRVFTGYSWVENELNEYSRYFQGKPCLLTEWGFALSSSAADTFIFSLGFADIFLAILKGWEEGIVEAACMHMFYSVYNYNSETIKWYKPGHGVMYKMLTDTFLSGTLFASSLSSPLLSGQEQGVHARCIKTSDEKIKIFAVNKYPKTAACKIIIDNNVYIKPYKITCYRVEDPVKTYTYSLQEDPLQYEEKTGTLVLPAYSISIAELN